ncbi:MAG: hypothetical protein ACOY45_10490 [Pseudomonadota bacterium]
MTPEPIAALGDTLTLTLALLLLRQLLLAVPVRAGRWHRIARFGAVWARRLVIVALLLPVLRLVSIAVARPDIAAPVAGLALLIVAAGGMLLVADDWIAARRARGGGQAR